MEAAFFKYSLLYIIKLITNPHVVVRSHRELFYACSFWSCSMMTCKTTCRMMPHISRVNIHDQHPSRKQKKQCSTGIAFLQNIYIYRYVSSNKQDRGNSFSCDILTIELMWPLPYILYVESYLQKSLPSCQPPSTRLSMICWLRPGHTGWSTLLILSAMAMAASSVVMSSLAALSRISLTSTKIYK